MLLSMIIVWNDDYLPWQTFAIKNSIAANVCLVNSQNSTNGGKKQDLRIHNGLGGLYRRQAEHTRPRLRPGLRFLPVKLTCGCAERSGCQDPRCGRSVA